MALLIATWNFHERVDRGRGVITHWIDKSRLSKKAQANMDRALDQLRQLPKTSWSKPKPASSLGNHTYVIRFKDVTGAQLRIFGHFFDDHTTFVMTFDGYEKDDAYYPDDYQEMAKRYKGQCDADFPIHTTEFQEHCALCREQRSTTRH